MLDTSPRALWLAWRSGADTPADRPTLGATDCAVVVCQLMEWPTFRSTADLYKARWGAPCEEQRLTAATARLDVGNALEPYVLDRWHAAHRQIRAPGPWLTVASHPWWRGSLDCAPVDGAIVDAKTTTWAESGHWYDSADRPVWPPAYLVQLAQYAIAARAAGHHVDRVVVAMIDLAKPEELHERTALLTDPVADHIDPDLAIPSHEDGAPFTVEDLGHAALALSDRFRADHLLGDVPPMPPPDGPIVSWWCARPRDAKASRPATAAEEAAIADYLAALDAEKAAALDKATARASLARSMSESDPVARLVSPLASVSISAAGTLTIRGKKDAPGV